MSLVVGSARIDERGRISGGKPGDQTGMEVGTQPYYMHAKGWYCLRPKVIHDADEVAGAMLEACANRNIGYCQNHRSGVIEQIRAFGSLARISVKTEADCSSLVRACCIQAGFDPGNFNTASEVAVLKATGRFQEPFEVTASTTLYNGDILVTKTKGHTLVVVSGNPRQPVQSGGSTVKAESARYRDDKVAGTYKVTTGLNLRAGAGTRKKIIIVMPKGSKVRSYGYYNMDGKGKRWLYVTYNSGTKTYTGYASSSCLIK
ncbi:SH3 domain-containing protein [Clostridium sp.]|jgi:hypothetical protein|uniref:SH3 domain-containing protein n=1 Tax=Clostridium sp. TaxID=1506 RepID=UPI00307E97E9